MENDTPFDDSDNDPEIRKSADRIMAREFDHLGNWASGLCLEPIGEDGHAVANLLWKIAAYLEKRDR